MPSFIPDAPGLYTLELVVNDGLVEFNAKDMSIIEPAVAERFEISDDGLVYDFWLRNNVFFHNGRQVTAEPACQPVPDLCDICDPHTGFDTAAFQQIEQILGGDVAGCVRRKGTPAGAGTIGRSKSMTVIRHSTRLQAWIAEAGRRWRQLCDKLQRMPLAYKLSLFIMVLVARGEAAEGNPLPHIDDSNALACTCNGFKPFSILKGYADAKVDL